MPFYEEVDESLVGRNRADLTFDSDKGVVRVKSAHRSNPLFELGVDVDDVDTDPVDSPTVASCSKGAATNSSMSAMPAGCRSDATEVRARVTPADEPSGNPAYSSSAGLVKALATMAAGGQGYTPSTNTDACDGSLAYEQAYVLHADKRLAAPTKLYQQVVQPFTARAGTEGDAGDVGGACTPTRPLAPVFRGEAPSSVAKSRAHTRPRYGGSGTHSTSNPEGLGHHVQQHARHAMDKQPCPSVAYVFSVGADHAGVHTQEERHDSFEFSVAGPNPAYDHGRGGWGVDADASAKDQGERTQYHIFVRRPSSASSTSSAVNSAASGATSTGMIMAVADAEDSYAHPPRNSSWDYNGDSEDMYTQNSRQCTDDVTHAAKQNAQWIVNADLTLSGHVSLLPMAVQQKADTATTGMYCDPVRMLEDRLRPGMHDAVAARSRVAGTDSGSSSSRSRSKGTTHARIDSGSGFKYAQLGEMKADPSAMAQARRASADAFTSKTRAPPNRKPKRRERPK